MKQRCTNPLNPEYHRYGGACIEFDPKWELFDNFFEDMGEPPEGRSLDRIDSSKDYTKDNCRWATASQQNSNQKLNKRNSTGYKGLYWDEKHNRWIVKGTFEGKTWHIYCGKDKEKAIQARKNWEDTVRYSRLKELDNLPPA